MTATIPTRAVLEDMLIRDLVDRYPDAMPVLVTHGLDLCCGGGHMLAEALDLHGLPKDEVMSQVLDAITHIQFGDSN